MKIPTIQVKPVQQFPVTQEQIVELRKKKSNSILIDKTFCTRTKIIADKGGFIRINGKIYPANECLVRFYLFRHPKRATIVKQAKSISAQADGFLIEFTE